MAKKPDDNLTRALTLLQETAGSPQPSGLWGSADSKPADILELFLAELKMRRAHLREWIDMLNREADRNPEIPVRRENRPARRGCRSSADSPPAR